MDYLCANWENVLQLVLFLKYGEKYAKKSPCFKHFTVLQNKAFVDRFYFFMFAFCISHTSICIYPPLYSSLKKMDQFHHQLTNYYSRFHADTNYLLLPFLTSSSSHSKLASTTLMHRRRQVSLKWVKLQNVLSLKNNT